MHTIILKLRLPGKILFIHAISIRGNRVKCTLYVVHTLVIRPFVYVQ